jgi:hypothetical protein
MGKRKQEARKQECHPGVIGEETKTARTSGEKTTRTSGKKMARSRKVC